MEMEETFDRLKKLQQNLVEKYAIEDRQRDEPQRVNQFTELLESTQKKYIEKNNEYEEAKKNKFQIREELDAAVKSRENGEAGMDNITSHREYEALKIQIDAAKEKEKDFRELLKKHEKIESELKEEVDSLKNEIDEYKATVEENKKEADKNLEKYKKDLDKLQKDADKIITGLDPEIVFKFERIIRRNSEGIVAVKNKVCTGCHMILPAQFVNEVRKDDKINFCPYCSRILFYEESSEEDDTYNIIESGSLSDEDEIEERDFDDDYNSTSDDEAEDIDSNDDEDDDKDEDEEES